MWEKGGIFYDLHGKAYKEKYASRDARCAATASSAPAAPAAPRQAAPVVDASAYDDDIPF